MIRDLLRSSVEFAATGAGLTAIARRAVRHRVAVLAYHNVVADTDAGRGDSSLHLPLSEFVRQIERISRSHDIVDLDTAASLDAGDRPRAVITFDDAYRGAVTLALPELVRRGLPAVVFVAPSLLGSATTWWDELGELGMLSDCFREAALHELGGRGEVIRRHVGIQGGRPRLPNSYDIASEHEVQLNCRGRITLGSHTWAHEYLPALRDSELRESLRNTQEWLDRYDGPTSRWLALPYGGASADVSRLALEMGHTGVLEISGGLWKQMSARARVPRINIAAGVSLRGVELRISGLRE